MTLKPGCKKGPTRYALTSPSPRLDSPRSFLEAKLLYEALFCMFLYVVERRYQFGTLTLFIIFKI